MKPLCLLSMLYFCGLSITVVGQSANVKILSQWIDALNRQDLDALSTIYADSVQLESPNWERTKIGKSETKDVYRRYFCSTPDLK